MKLAEIPGPQTPASQAALEVVTEYSSTALVNHCIRSYLWAASYGTAHHVGYDAELLYVSAMLHDIGLAARFDNHADAFEMAGGNVAWVFGAGAGWPVDRRVRSSEVIIRHMWDHVDVAADPEGHLLGIATGLDISGRNPGWWPSELRREVVSSYPRLALTTEFVSCFQDQARRKPESSAGASVRSGIGDRIAANVLDGPDPGA